MPTSSTFPQLRAATIITSLLIAVLAMIPATASAKTDIRVVTKSGKTLAEHRQYTDKTMIKTDPSAECFGEGTGGSGDVYRDKARTAAGQLFDAKRAVKQLKPVTVSDAFDFGLAICGIGGVDPSPSGFWYIKINHSAAQVGADQIELSKGDDVLWWEIADFSNPPPAELVLKSRARTTSPTLQVTVFEYADDGTKTPAVGANVTGAPLPTDAQGKTNVAIPNSSTVEIQATRAGAIPSNAESVCRGAKRSDCSPGHAIKIYGTKAADKVKGTKGDNVVRSGNGNDTVDIRKGGRDRVFCGAGRRDRVIVAKGDNNDKIRPSCEKTIQR